MLFIILQVYEKVGWLIKLIGLIACQQVVNDL